MRLIPLLAAAALMSSAAHGAERNISVTSFSKLVVSGPYAVTVKTGQGASAHVEGEPAAIDALTIDQVGETLTIRGNGSADEGAAHGPIAVTLTTPSLERVNLSGSGSVAVDHVSGDHPAIVLAGTGSLQVARADGDHLGVTMAGSGALSIAGRAAIVGMLVQGTGTLDAGGLRAEDLSIMASGSGSIKAAASRTASINAEGSMVVDVTGDPACHTKAAGSAKVTCGASGRS